MYIAHARDLVRHAYIQLESERGGGGGGFVYKIKTLRSNLAPPKRGGRGVYSRGAYIRTSTVY